MDSTRPPYRETLDTIQGIDGNALEEIFQTLIMEDHEGYLTDVADPAVIDLLRKHEAGCETCQNVRKGLGEPIFKGVEAVKIVSTELDLRPPEGGVYLGTNEAKIAAMKTYFSPLCARVETMCAQLDIKVQAQRYTGKCTLEGRQSEIDTLQVMLEKEELTGRSSVVVSGGQEVILGTDNYYEQEVRKVRSHVAATTGTFTQVTPASSHPEPANQ